MMRTLALFVISFCITCVACGQKTFPDYFAIDDSLQNLMKKWNIPGMQLAIVYNDSIVHHASLGYANLQLMQHVTDSSLFRIASLSKPITLVAILRLVGEGRIELDEGVFGKRALLPYCLHKRPERRALMQITLEDLMKHRAGWNNALGDPMFSDSALSQSEIIFKVINNDPLPNQPGTTYSYSNFGYLLLGRIIEKVTQMDYEEYVRNSLFTNSEQLYIARNTISQQLPCEVVYYSQEKVSPYEINVARMDAHGGWVSNARTLVRFLTRINRNPIVKDVLTNESLSFYYLGFDTWVHTGSLPGTFAIMVRKGGCWGYVVLCNSRPKDCTTFESDIRKMVESCM